MAAPYEDEAVSFWAGVNNFDDYWVSMASRRIDNATTSRGRQYELDTVQAGEYHPTYDNRDNALTPGNTASPYYPNVVPYRPIRKRMQHPATVNMLTPNQASAGEAVAVTTIDAPVAPGGTVPFVYGGFSNPVVATSSSAFQGSQVFQETIPASPTTGAALIFMTGVTLMPGRKHTFSAYVRTVAGANALQVRAVLTWFDASQNFLSQTTGTALTLPVASTTWTRVQVTGTPPANAAAVWVGVACANSPSTACTFQLDSAQLEYDQTTASTFVKPNTWYPIFKGFVERWPVRWDNEGLFNKIDVTAVDHFGYLSQQILKPPFYMDMLSVSASQYPLRFFYTFDVGQTADHVTDLAHKRGPAPVVSGLYGAGSLTFGNSVTATAKPSGQDVVGGEFLGGASTVATFGNTTSNVANPHLPATYIDLTAAAGYVPPTGDGSGWYTRVCAFRCTSNPTWFATIWGINNPTYQNSFTGGLSLRLTNGGALEIDSWCGFAPGSVCDGDWHFAAWRINPSGGNIATYADGNEQATATVSSFNTTMTSGTSDSVGVYITPGVQNVGYGFSGDVAFVAEFAGYVDTGTLTTLYRSWAAAWLGDTSSNRFSRVLGWASFYGASTVDQNPATLAMGPATDITAGGQQATIYSPVTGTDVQTALNNIATTEGGNSFVSAGGVLTFQSRSARYGASTPAVVFGENEIPYEDTKFDFDPTRLANDVQVTQYMTSAVYEAFAPTSQQQYGTRTLTRTVNAADPLEVNDAASYFAYRYSNPDLRIKTVRIHVSAAPSAWATLLSLELGMKARVMRRDLAYTIQWDGWIEKISWSFDYSQNDVFVDLELSPADITAFWFLGAMHTTLSSAVTVTQMNSNSTFESGISPWTATSCTVVQSQVQVHSGTYSAQVTPSGSAATTYIISEQVAVTAGTLYAAHSWVWFTNAVTNNYYTGIAWFDSTHTYISTSGTRINAAAQTWTLAASSATAPAGAAYAAIQLVLDGTPPATQVWYADDATITNAVTSITCNPLPSASTMPVGAHISNGVIGSGSTVQVTGYPTLSGTVPAPKLRLGAGTATWEEVAITSYTSTGGTPVTNYAGNTVPGQFTGYTSVTFTLATPLLNSYASGTTVSEALPANMSDPTAHDVDTVLGTTTIIGY